MAKKCPACQSENPDTSHFCADCGATLDPAKAAGPQIPGATETLRSPLHDLPPGSTFAGRYQVIEEIGHGGMGRVYKVFDTKIKDKVALKLIRPDVAADPDTIERFSNEIRLSRKIGHRNVCRMFDIGEADGARYITMEYVHGEDLKSMIRMSGSLSLGMLLSVGQQIADGLAEAHHLGVVHRDLKPQNIMIDKNGNAKIMDFGIARSVREKGITGPSVMIGTPEYMSPEQAEAKDVDHRSDIYSLGVILYEMATSHVPFTGETALAIAMKHKGEAPKDPRKLNPGLPADLSAVILKCLEKDKARRFQSAADLHAELERIERGLPTTEKFVPARKPISSKEISIKLNLKKKILIPILGALGVLAAAFIVWQIIPRSGGPRPSIAVIAFKNQTGDKAYDYLREAIPNLLITSLEQSRRFQVTTWEGLKDSLGELGRDRDAPIDEDLGFELCRRKGIKTIVVGTYTKAGGMFATDAKVWDVGAHQILRTAAARGEGVDSILRSQIDELSRSISKGKGLEALRIEAAQPKLAEALTGSLEAYNYYLRGREDLDKMLYTDAKKFLEKAVEIDPAFASAYLLLGEACWGLGEGNARAEALKKAKEHSLKAPEKARLYIEANYAFAVEGDGQKQIRIWEEIARKYPGEKDVHYELGTHFRDRGEFSQAIAEFKRALDIDPKFGVALNGLAYVYADSGDFGKALEYFQKYAAVSPGDPNPLDSIAELSLREGNLDEAIRKYGEVLEVRPDFALSKLSIAFIHALKEDYAETIKIVEDFRTMALSAEGMELDYHLTKAFFHYWLGNTTKALAELDAHLGLARSLGSGDLVTGSYLRGYIALERGEFDQAEKAYRTCQEYWEKGGVFLASQKETMNLGTDLSLGLLEVKTGKISSARARLAKYVRVQDRADLVFLRDWLSQIARCLEGEILLAEGKPDEVVRKLAKAPGFNWTGITLVSDVVAYHLPLEKDAVARAYKALGETDKAIAEYWRLMTIDPSNQVRQLIPPIYHFRLAGLYEAKGDKAKAREQYAKFLEIWKDADPGRPELREARKRLAAL